MAGALSGFAAKALGKAGTISRGLRLRRFAESLYGLALKVDHHHVGVAYGCGRLRERRRAWDAAMAAYSVPIDAGTADVAHLLVRRGTVAQRLERFDEAIADFLAAEHPDPVPFVRLAKKCRRNGRLPTAVVALERVRQLTPSDATSVRLLADTYRGLGEFNAACETYRDVIAAGEPDADVRCALAKTIRRQTLVPFELRGGEPVAPSPGSFDARYSEAIAQLELAAFTSSRHVHTAFLLGRFMEELGRYTDAARMMRLALSRLDSLSGNWVPEAKTEWQFRLARVVHALNPSDAADQRLSRTVFPGVSSTTLLPPSGYVEASVSHRGLEIEGFILPTGRQAVVDFHVDDRYIASAPVSPDDHLPGFRFCLTHALLEEFPRQARLSVTTPTGTLAATGASRYLAVNVPDGTGKLSILLEEGHVVDCSGRLAAP